MAKIIVDNVEYEVEEGQNLLHACLSHKLELPYFCWHPSLGSVGACRQCAVIQYRDEDDDRGRLTMACMTPVSDGTRISINAEMAKGFRASVIEWLMENHPHDCPVCEEGGECHLQDMTVMTGHTQRRYHGQKRTFENQYLGPFINHEMNRCITCYRCVRFYRDYAGGTDLQAFGSRARMYFGRENDGVLENEFSGNLVEVCPTGVFTDKPFSKTYTRKWDLQSAPSICPGCAVGCNTFAAERYGRLKRIHNRYHGELNGYFLCDRGRFGAGFVNAEDRIEHVGERVSDGEEDDLFQALDPDLGMARFAEMILKGGVVGVGSPRASLETNVVLKALVGDDRFCTGLSSAEDDAIGLALDIYRAGAGIASLADVENADAVLILGEDVLNTAPRVALALRQTVRNESMAMAADAAIPLWQDAGVRGHAQHRLNPLYLASVLPTRIDDIATARLNAIPEQLADGGFDIAAHISGQTSSGQTSSGQDGSAETGSNPGTKTRSDFVRDAAEALAAAERPLIISGTGSGSRRVIEAAGAVAQALENARKTPSLMLVAPEANSFGCGLLGGELDMNTVLEQASHGEIKTLIVAENDLFRRARADRVKNALAAVDNLVVLDSLDTPTATLASLVFPAATFAESTGTFINLETRAQRFYSVFSPRGEIAPTWRWLAQTASQAERDLGWTHVDDVLQAAATRPNLERAAAAIPETKGLAQQLPRETPRYSGRTAMNANVNIHEPKTTVDEETPLSFSMEGQSREASSALLPFVWSPGWNSNQSVYKYQQQVGGAVMGGDPGVRLLNAARTASYPARTDTFDDAAAAADGRFRLLPVQTIFGSDELSYRSPPVAERTPQAFVVLNPEDARRLGVGDGGATQGVGVKCPALGASFALRVDPAMQAGYAGVSVGLPGADNDLPSDPVELQLDPDFRPARGPSANMIAKG